MSKAFEFIEVKRHTGRTSQRALDASMNDLSGQRRTLVTAAHELSHHMLTGNTANDSGMSSVFAALELIASHWSAKPPLAFVSTSRVASDERQWAPPAWISELLHDIGYRSPQRVTGDFTGMPSWTITDYLGMPPLAWLRSDDAEVSNLKHDELSALFRLLDGVVPFSSLPPSAQASVVRFIETVLALAGLRFLQLISVSRDRRTAFAGVRRPPGTPTFVRSVLAACRRYGHRAEPDDHASLFTRQKQVSMGSYALVC